MLEWLSLSPDMSPIEHAWDELARRISARHQPPRNLNELTNALINEWNNSSASNGKPCPFNEAEIYCMHSGKWQLHSLLIATFECKGIDI